MSDLGFGISDTYGTRVPNPKSDLQNPKYTEGVSFMRIMGSFE